MVRIIKYPNRDGPQDIEVFYVYNGNIIYTHLEPRSEYGDSGSGSHQFYDLTSYGIGYHISGQDSFSSTVYVNTWNHMMDTTDTNPTMRKVLNRH